MDSIKELKNALDAELVLLRQQTSTALALFKNQLTEERQAYLQDKIEKAQLDLENELTNAQDEYLKKMAIVLQKEANAKTTLSKRVVEAEKNGVIHELKFNLKFAKENFGSLIKDLKAMM